jgi:hypothetical protein
MYTDFGMLPQMANLGGGDRAVPELDPPEHAAHVAAAYARWAAGDVAPTLAEARASVAAARIKIREAREACMAESCKVIRLLQTHYGITWTEAWDLQIRLAAASTSSETTESTSPEPTHV